MFNKRIEKLVSKMEDLDVDALLITKEENVSYLSGFTGDESYLFITPKEQYMLTDFRYIEQVKQECPDLKIFQWKRIADFGETSLREWIQSFEIARLGIEKNNFSYGAYLNFTKHLPKIELVATHGAVEELRYVKNEHEIACIQKAASIADRAFTRILDFIKPGMTENEVTAELEYYLRKEGADGVAFDTILVSGVKTSLPHGKPSDKVIEKGDFVTLDFGALYQGYRSDMTRTIGIGSLTEKQKEIYQMVKEAQLAGLQAIKAGVHGKKPDEAAREVFAKKDLNEYFGHGLGHGLGLEIHEEPFMGGSCTMRLEKDYVVTVEPGLYLPNWGGVRIEDTVVVTEEGCTILTNSSKELIILGD